MKYFENNREVTLQMLEESNNYSSEIIAVLKSQQYNKLNNLISTVERTNKDFMEPLLFAVKNEYGTYKIYKYYGENLQKNIELVKEIVNAEPDVIENTEISKNKDIMKVVLEESPRSIKYVDEILKQDNTFIKEILSENNNKELRKSIIEECNIFQIINNNPEILNDKEFMKEAITQNVDIMKYSDDNLKDDYNFIKENCKENVELIDYIANNANDFGNEGIKAAKEVLVDNVADKAIKEIREELDIIKNKKENETDAVNGKDEDALKKRQLENGFKLIERIKNGEVKQERAIRLINKLCKNLGEEYREELLKYIKMDDIIVNREDREKELHEIGKETKNISPVDIEKKTEGVSLEGINKAANYLVENRKRELNNNIKENNIGEKRGEDIDR